MGIDSSGEGLGGVVIPFAVPGPVPAGAGASGHIVVPLGDDVGMGFGGGIGAAVEAVGGSAARLDALVRQAGAQPGAQPGAQAAVAADARGAGASAGPGSSAGPAGGGVRSSGAVALVGPDQGAGGSGGRVRDWWADPMRVEADAVLDVMAEAARLEAKAAALKARAAARFAELETALAPPAAKAAGMVEVSITAEIGCLLRISDGAAGLFLSQARALCTQLPWALDALQAGAITWRHAVITCDETTGLTGDGTAALAARFLTLTPAATTNPPSPADPAGPDGPADPDDPDGPGDAADPTDPAGTADPADPAGSADFAGGGVWGCVAGDLTPGRFRSRARAWRERHHPETLEKRHAKGVADRRVECSPDRDGMSWFSAYLPAHQAEAIWNRTTAIARALQGPTEPRTLTQLRADIFATALLTNNNTPTRPSRNTRPGTNGNGAGDGAGAGNDANRRGPFTAGDSGAWAAGMWEAGVVGTGTGNADDADFDVAGAAGRAGNIGGAGSTDNGGLARVPVPRAQVLVTVPVFALLGLTDDPAELDGYGPVPASMARDILVNGADSFHRVLVDPRDGAPLEIGRTSYRIPQAMRNWLRLRDTKCPFPGCTNHSLDNEADHLTAWHHGGATGITNLAQTCPKHHKLKHASNWTPTPATTTSPPGWTSPTGRHYTNEPHPWEPPTLPTNTLFNNALNNRTTPIEPPGHTLPGNPPTTHPHQDLTCQDLNCPDLTCPDLTCPDPEEPPGPHLIDTHDLDPDDPRWDTYPCPDTLPPDPMGEAWEAFQESIHNSSLLPT